MLAPPSERAAALPPDRLLPVVAVRWFLRVLPDAFSLLGDGVVESPGGGVGIGLRLVAFGCELGVG